VPAIGERAWTEFRTRRAKEETFNTGTVKHHVIP
jgi:hypothetical protein